MLDSSKNQPQYLELSTGRVSYFEYGAKDGSPLFFFHGWPGSGRQGEILHTAALELGVRVIAISRPGILGSKLIPNRRLVDWPQFLGQVADKLGIQKFRVLGVSGGGPYALASAYGLPDRIEQAVVISGAPLLRLFGDASQLFWVYRVLLAIRNKSRFALNLLLNFFRLLLPLKIHNIGFRLLAKSMPAADKYALFEKNFIAEVSQSFEDHLGSGAEALISDAEIYLQDPGFRLEDIRMPVTFWHGEVDRNIPIKVTYKMAEMLKQKEVFVSPSDGHYSLALLEAQQILRWMYQGTKPEFGKYE